MLNFIKLINSSTRKLLSNHVDRLMSFWKEMFSPHSGAQNWKSDKIVEISVLLFLINYSYFSYYFDFYLYSLYQAYNSLNLYECTWYNISQYYSVQCSSFASIQHFWQNTLIVLSRHIIVFVHLYTCQFFLKN